MISESKVSDLSLYQQLLDQSRNRFEAALETQSEPSESGESIESNDE